MQEFKIALRQLGNAPGLTLVAVFPRAPGAGRLGVSSLGVRDGLKSVFLGVAAGALAGCAVGKLLAAQLDATSGSAPLVFTLVSVPLVTVGSLACWLPARRATRINPVEALRAE